VAGHILDREAVLAANNAFYFAHEEGDLDTMRDLWLKDDQILCTHPGWPCLRGWDAVWSVWERLLSLSHRPQFIVTDAQVEVVGDVAWVSCDENLLGDGSGSTVSALNVFVCSEGSWRMVAHHASPVIR
jgi:ketosteroid isomerase-like protein